MSKITFAGVGSALTMQEYYQSDMIITHHDLSSCLYISSKLFVLNNL
jgi:hypothetical protein